MTAAQILHFFILIGLAILAFITFLVAGTILALMIVEDAHCKCVHFPVGLIVLFVFWILLLIWLIRELIDSPVLNIEWIRNHQEALIVALIIFLVLLFIL
jgi:hypothetical protein